MKLTKRDTILTVVAIIVVVLLLYHYHSPKESVVGVADVKEAISEPVKDLSSQVSGGSNGYLRGLKEVQLVIRMNDNAKSVVDEDAIRVEMEFNLRRSGLIVVGSKAPYVLVYGLSTQKREGLNIYNTDCRLVERATFLRGDETPVVGLYQVWNSSLFGTVGVDNARDALVRQTGDVAMQFASAWTEANTGF